MGLYIKDMEIPKKSGQYVLYLDVYGDPPAAPPAVHMADCVRYFVFEVPEPHGRLIDADKLADSFEPSDFWNPDAEDNCFAAVRIVHSASTVIPASVEGE